MDQCRTGVIVGGNVAGANIDDPDTDDSDGHITIVVNGGSYEVRLPARGTSHMFPVS